MERIGSYFWLTVIVAVGYFVWMGSRIEIVGLGYHPMSVYGHVGAYYFRLFAVVAGITVLGSSIIVILSDEVEQSSAGALGVILLLVITVGHYSLLHVETNYEQVYWVGNVKHRIPWRYAPYNGDTEQGGSVFFVKVSPEELGLPPADNDASEIKLAKAKSMTDLGFEGPLKSYCSDDAKSSSDQKRPDVFHSSKRKPPRFNMRHEFVSRSSIIRCAEQKGTFFYLVTGEGLNAVRDVSPLISRAKKIFDKFVDASTQQND